MKYPKLTANQLIRAWKKEYYSMSCNPERLKRIEAVLRKHKISIHIGRHHCPEFITKE